MNADNDNNIILNMANICVPREGSLWPDIYNIAPPPPAQRTVTVQVENHSHSSKNKQKGIDGCRSDLMAVEVVDIGILCVGLCGG